MFVYFYNSFQAFELPVCLGKSPCLSLTYLWLKCLRLQARKQRRPRVPVVGPRRPHTSKDKDAAWQKLLIRFPCSLHPHPKVFYEECFLSSHFLPKHGTLYAKKNKVGDIFFKCSDFVPGAGACWRPCSGESALGTDRPLQSPPPVFSLLIVG